MKLPPFRYLIVVLVVIFTNGLYILWWTELPTDGCYKKFGEIETVISVVDNTPAHRAGIQVGDQILSIQGEPVPVWLPFVPNFKVGATVNYIIQRNGEELIIPVTLVSRWNQEVYFYILYYLFILSLISTGIFILFKKPEDPTIRMFFLFLMAISVTLNGIKWGGVGPLPILRNTLFIYALSFRGAFLLHFFLIFPNRMPLYQRFPSIVKILYAVSFFIALTHAIAHPIYYSTFSDRSWFYYLLTHYSLFGWLSFSCILGLSIAFYRLKTTSESIAHNQLRWVVIGAFWGAFFSIVYGFSPFKFEDLRTISLYSFEIFLATEALGVIIFFTFAIIRYHLWDIEVIIKRGLLYAGVSLSVIGFYMLLLFLAEFVVQEQTNTIRILALVLVSLTFFPIRDILQTMIDKIFHREKYDPTRAAFEFEGNLVGVYEEKELYSKITSGLNVIFHFVSFLFMRREKERLYKVVSHVGDIPQEGELKIITTDEFERLLERQKVFAVRELQEETPLFKIVRGELIVPLYNETEVMGFFVCGQKRSEKPYSQQDIQLLSLLARNSIGFLRTADLYHRELKRRIILEQERARISKDMHDEVGASLTRIAILSELAKRDIIQREGSHKQIDQISQTAREVVDNIGEIIWAINPKNDTLDNLVAYIREYAAKYFEMTAIHCHLDFPETIPSKLLSAEFRRNVFLAVKEALHNVVKHSNATDLRIKLGFNKKRLQLNINDNGRGFDKDGLSFSGSGLGNMRRRITDIGGDFNLKTQENVGTEINFSVEIKQHAV